MDMTGVVVHVLNRAVKKAALFSTPEDYQAFLQVLEEALERFPLRILAFCVMPNHWHFVVWPGEPGVLSRFMHWLCVTHAGRWHGARASTGTGAVYQGRFKAFPVQSDDHVLRVMRYVERNALRAKLVATAEDWRWGSAWHRLHGDPRGFLSEGPVELPQDWLVRINEPEPESDLVEIRTCSRRGSPLGSDAWREEMAPQWGLDSTLRPRGRPRKPPAKTS